MTTDRFYLVVAADLIGFADGLIGRSADKAALRASFLASASAQVKHQTRSRPA
ncbi:MAG: hypothetical protein VW493_02450 [Gammaproteobacteria bacterium]